MAAIVAGSLVERLGPALRLRFSRERDAADEVSHEVASDEEKASERPEAHAIAA